MQKKVSRIIIDTNLWISFLITKNFSQLDHIIFSNRYILIFSQELLEEFLEVVKRPKFEKFFSNLDIEKILEIIEEYADFIEVKTNIVACRDSKDNFLLSLAFDGKADFLITGDDDLLSLVQFDKTKIISITNFMKVK
jgi:putative PIN family toxin of toxin-antitoxin system